MAIVEQNEAELADIGRRLSDWLQDKLPDARDIRLERFRRPGGSGFSNDTLLGDICYEEGGQSKRRPVVIRIAPPPDAINVFPFYDIPRQFDIMQAIEAHSSVPVPHCLWKESDPAVLGLPFYVMDFIGGDIPADNPPYGKEGFLVDATPAQREQLWYSAIAAMAQLHRLDFRDAGLDFLGFPDSTRSPIAQHLQFYEDYFHWARDGEDIPVAQAALDYLKANMPTGEPEVISWGDARIGNVIFQEFKAVALLDWEMAATGSPEVDLAWFMFVDKVNQRGNGMPDNEFDPLDGMPDDAATVAYYEKCSGHTVKHFDYYTIFAGFRFACVMIRIMRRTGAEGLMPEEFVPVLQRSNVVTQLLAELMGLPAPE